MKATTFDKKKLGSKQIKMFIFLQARAEFSALKYFGLLLGFDIAFDISTVLALLKT